MKFLLCLAVVLSIALAVNGAPRIKRQDDWTESNTSEEEKEPIPWFRYILDNRKLEQLEKLEKPTPKPSEEEKEPIPPPLKPKEPRPKPSEEEKEPIPSPLKPKEPRPKPSEEDEEPIPPELKPEEPGPKPTDPGTEPDENVTNPVNPPVNLNVETGAGEVSSLAVVVAPVYVSVAYPDFFY